MPVGRGLAALAAVCALAAAACGRAPGGETDAAAGGAAEVSAVVVVRDDAGREVRLAAPARRVVSLVPSVTETIVALGAARVLVARTDYDQAPGLAALPSVGGGLDPGVEGLLALGPDLVVAWDARDDAGLRARLEAAGIAVYAAAVEDTAAVFSTIERMGALVGRARAADSVAAALRDTLRAIAREAVGSRRPRALFLLDGAPPRIAGRTTFVAELLEVAGAEPAYPEVGGRWPAISLETVVADPPDVVVVPVGEGEAPALGERPGWRAVPAAREGRVIGVPADLVSRPGPGIGRAARALRDSLRAAGARTGAW